MHNNNRSIRRSCTRLDGSGTKECPSPLPKTGQSEPDRYRSSSVVCSPTRRDRWWRITQRSGYCSWLLSERLPINLILVTSGQENKYTHTVMLPLLTQHRTRASCLGCHIRNCCCCCCCWAHSLTFRSFREIRLKIVRPILPVERCPCRCVLLCCVVPPFRALAIHFPSHSFGLSGWAV